MIPTLVLPSLQSIIFQFLPIGRFCGLITDVIYLSISWAYEYLRILVGIAISSFLVPVGLSADIEFQFRTFEFKADLADEKAVVSFPFQVVGNRSITIESIHSSCGCTVARLEKRTFQPGESGEIPVEFLFEDRVGPQYQSVEIVLKEYPGNPVKLSLQGTIPYWVRIIPRVVYWHQNSSPSAKTITVKPHPSVDISLSPSDEFEEAFLLNVGRIKPATDIVLSIQPKSLEEPRDSILTVKAYNPNFGEKYVKIICIIR